MRKIHDLETQLFNRSPNELPENIGNQSCFPTLSFKERITAFIIFNALGYIIQLGSFLRFLSAATGHDPMRFALLYSIGNILAIIGILFLVGIEQHTRMVTNPTRRMISLIFFGSLILSIIIPLIFHNKIGRLFTFIFVIIQMISYWWYTLSYIPGARMIVSGCLSCFRSLF